MGAAVRHVRLPYGNIVGLDALQHGEADVVVVAVDVGHFFTAAGERRAGNDHIGLQWAKIFRQKPVAHAKLIHCVGHDAGVQLFEAGHQLLYRRHFHICHNVKPSLFSEWAPHSARPVYSLILPHRAGAFNFRPA